MLQLTQTVDNGFRRISEEVRAGSFSNRDRDKIDKASEDMKKVLDMFLSVEEAMTTMKSNVVGLKVQQEEAEDNLLADLPFEEGE